MQFFFKIQKKLQTGFSCCCTHIAQEAKFKEWSKVLLKERKLIGILQVGEVEITKT